MSTLIPLPNFYKKAEKAKKRMVDKKSKKKAGDIEISEPPKPTLISEQRPRTFATVTSLGNTVTKKVKEETDETVKLDLLKSGIADCIKQLVSIAFEKADVNDLISNDPAFQPLQFFDPMAIFTKDINSLQAGKVLSMISNLQDTVVTLSEKYANEKNDHKDFLAKLEKVKFF